MAHAQILLWCHMTAPKHYPWGKRGFYKGQNWDINGRYLGRTRFIQLIWAYMAGLDWQTLEKYIHRSTEPVILDLWLACELCQTIIIKCPRNVAYLPAPVIILPPLWSTDQANTPRYWMKLGPRGIWHIICIYCSQNCGVTWMSRNTPSNRSQIGNAHHRSMCCTYSISAIWHIMHISFISKIWAKKCPIIF